MGQNRNVFTKRSFAERFLQLRQEPGNFNDHIEFPCVCRLLPPVFRKRILEIGCGGGHLTENLIRNGATAVHAVDCSEELLRSARDRVDSVRVNFTRTRIEKLPLRSRTYDIVVSSLVFHFISDLNGLFKKIYAAMKVGGVLVFSVRHPMRTANPAGDRRGTGWFVHRYAKSGVRLRQWLGDEVSEFHRPIEVYVQSLVKNRFSILEICEPIPVARSIQQYPDLAEALESPPFLVFKCRKIA